jgi:hypothetical protein
MSPYHTTVAKTVEACLGDEALNRLCFDHFRAIYEQFVAQPTRSDRTQLLVEYAERQGELDRLLGAAKDANPGMYVALGQEPGAVPAVPQAPAQGANALGSQEVTCLPASGKPLDMIDIEKRLSRTPCRVFISHRHVDKRIADAIRVNLTCWGVAEADIYQSSHAGGGPPIGDEIKKDVKENLGRADLFILVYTGKRQDWPLFELGIASARGLRIVVFQFSAAAPPMQQGERNVRITEEDVLTFTNNFHKHERFFLDKPPFAPGLPPEVHRERGRQLYRDLRQAASPRRKWPYVLAALVGAASATLLAPWAAPSRGFPKLNDLVAKAQARGRPYVVESLTILARIEKEHKGICKDTNSHVGCQFQRVVRGKKVYLLHALSDRNPGPLMLKENSISDWGDGVEHVPGVGEEKLVGGGERRKEWEIYANAPAREGFSIVTGYKCAFPMKKHPRLILRDLSTGPEEGNCEHVTELDFVGELTMLVESESLPLSPVLAYRAKGTGEIERTEVDVRLGFGQHSDRKTLSKRWTNLEPGDTIGIIYSWRRRTENE